MDFFKYELEYPVTWYFRPDKVRHLSLRQMMHNLILTRLLVSAKKWTEKRSDCDLLQVKTCYEAGSDYPSVESMKEGKRERIKISDARLLFEKVKTAWSVPFFLRLTGRQPTSTNLKIILRRELIRDPLRGRRHAMHIQTAVCILFIMSLSNMALAAGGVFSSVGSASKASGLDVGALLQKFAW